MEPSARVAPSGRKCEPDHIRAISDTIYDSFFMCDALILKLLFDSTQKLEIVKLKIFHLELVHISSKMLNSQ